MMKRIRIACLTGMLLLVAVYFAGCSPRSYAAIPSDEDVLLVAGTRSHTVSFLQADTGEMLAEWKIPFAFNRILLLPDHHSVLLYHKDEKQAHVIDMRDGKEKHTWDTGIGIVNAVASADGQAVYLADRERGMLRVYNLNGQMQKEVKVGSYPMTIIPEPDGERVYVYDLHEAKGYAVQINTGRVTHTFAVNESPMGGLYIQKRGELWVGGHGKGDVQEEVITVVSPVSGEKKGEIPAPSMPIEFVQYNEGTAFVLSHGSSTLRRIRIADQKVTGALILGANPVGMAAGRDRLYISSFESSQMYVVDPMQMKVVKTVRVGEGPMQMFVREGGQS